MRAAETRFDLAFDQMPMALTVTSLEDGRVQAVNETFLRLSGYTRAEVVGRTPEELGFWVEPELRRQRFAMFRAGRRPPDIEARFRTKSGEERIGVIASSMIEFNGRPCVLSTNLDITDRKNAEIALRAAERQLRLVTDHAPVILAYCDTEARYKFVNKAYAERFNLRPQDLTGKHISEILGTAAYATIEPYVRRVLAGNPVDFEVEVPYKIGGRQYVSCAYRPERDDSGRVVGMVAAIVDSTERKRAEEALRQADRRKDEFLASLAHELRNPLAPLRSGLEILRLAPDPATLENTRAMMDRQVSQLVRLVDDLLDVSRISRNKIELRREPVELPTIVERAVETVQDAIRDAGLELRVQLPKQAAPVYADRARLVQALSNILNNAAKFTPRGGRITITMKVHEHHVHLCVADTGIGMAADMLNQVFEPFVQAAAAMDRAHSGLGLGLAITRRLINMHGGHIEARSAGLGKGSEFAIWLPLPKAASQGDSTAQPALEPGPVRRIMVVDDNRDAVVTLALTLKLMQHEVRTAHAGLEALELGESFRPEIVLLDIGMPQLNGYETARRIRQRPWGKTAMLVAVTGFSQDSDRESTQRAGFDHHLVKPVDAATLYELLARIAMAEITASL